MKDKTPNTQVTPLFLGVAISGLVACSSGTSTIDEVAIKQDVSNLPQTSTQAGASTSIGLSRDAVKAEQRVSEGSLNVLVAAPTEGESGAARLNRPMVASTKQLPTSLIKLKKNQRSFSDLDKSISDSRLAQQPIVLMKQSFSEPPVGPNPLVTDTENYQELDDNSVIVASNQPTSTFSIDVDSGAYSNVRRFLNNGQLPPVDAVRVEELINYFSYDYPAPENSKIPFSVYTELATTPWNPKTRLLHIGLQGYLPHGVDSKGQSYDGPQQRPDANLVFLLDVSGSMEAPDKLGLLKSSLKMLSRELRKSDTVSIVVYAGASGVVLKPTSGNNYAKISSALERLRAGGSTNGEDGIRLAYQLATENFKPEGINRVILATDGDFNVGISDISTLKDVISKKRESGIALTTLGFGQGNYNDFLMEQLADTGNGNYAYIDTLNEARKVLVDELNATLLTIASDVKIQIEFNPALVTEYRLVGYVNRRLANEDFNNDRVDAGEIGAGHTVTALYEIALAGDGGELNTPLRYGKSAQSGDAIVREQNNRATAAPNLDVSSAEFEAQLVGELAELRLRYKRPGTKSSELIKKIVHKDMMREDSTDTSENFRFSAAVAAFGQHLRGAKYLNGYTLSDTADLARSAKGEDRFGYRAGFVQLTDLAGSLTDTDTTSHLQEYRDDMNSEQKPRSEG